MKRIIATLAIIALCTTSAFAWPILRSPSGVGHIQSYNNSYGQKTIVHPPIGLNGTFSRQTAVKAEYTTEFDGNCFRLLTTEWTKTVTVIYEYGRFISSSDSWSEGQTTVVWEFCIS